MKEVTSLAGWFGSNRQLAHHVGHALDGLSHVTILFAGSMPEVPYITASSILCNDQHRHIINLARCVADDALRPLLVRRLERKLFHPDELANAQELCKATWTYHSSEPETRLDLAENYFVTCWMGRAAKAGTKDEFNGRTANRWNANGGSSVIRYFSALRAVAYFARHFRRCAFETMDALDMAERVEDQVRNGVYADPPFPDSGRVYKHNAGQTEAEERAWHTRLERALYRLTKTCVVCRFYDHPLIRELYQECDGWVWHFLDGSMKQTREEAPEVLIIRNGKPDLFGV